jgi:RNA polymerase sigma-70 factor (ECF subfamily)
MVWRTLFRLLGHRADVDECFQETFLTAMETSRRQEIRHWSAWLQRVATSRAIDRLRKRRRNGVEIHPDTMDSMASSFQEVSHNMEAAERSDLLRKALVRLPANQAQAISLHALSGLSYQEIGAEMGMSSNAVGVLIHRAKGRLRELLEDSLGARPGGVW